MFAQAFAALVALSSLTQFVLAGACVRSYTIQAGDTCDKISASQNVSTYQLAVVNQGIVDASCSNLVPGKSICLGYEGEDCSTTYVVAANDTCDTIASNFGVNRTILSLNNPQIDTACSNIYVGEVLCTSQSVQVPSATAGPLSSSSTTSPATTVAPSPSATADDDNGDEDLPFCDEL